MIIKLLISLLFIFLAQLQAGLKIAAFHPLVADWAREIGADKVQVIDIAQGSQNLHQFEPGAKHILALEKADLWVFSGKGFETYAADLQEQLKPHQQVLDLGRFVPSRKLSEQEARYACCDAHTDIAVDPHWWHRVDYVERAIKVLSKRLQKMDSVNAGYYKEREKNYIKQLNDLNYWVKTQVATIPKKQRYLATDHAAFGYLCDQYGFKPLFLKGMTAENSIASKHLMQHMKIIKKYQIKTLFSEELSNPKMLKQIAQETGAKLGEELIADGHMTKHIHSYIAMMRHNISAIVKGLANN